MIGLSLHEGEGEAHVWLRSSLSLWSARGGGGAWGASSLPSCSAGLTASWTGSTPGNLAGPQGVWPGGYRSARAQPHLRDRNTFGGKQLFGCDLKSKTMLHTLIWYNKML